MHINICINLYINIYIYIKYIRLAWEDTPRCSGIVPCRPHAMACSNFVQISNFFAGVCINFEAMGAMKALNVKKVMKAPKALKCMKAMKAPKAMKAMNSYTVNAASPPLGHFGCPHPPEWRRGQGQWMQGSHGGYKEGCGEAARRLRGCPQTGFRFILPKR